MTMTTETTTPTRTLAWYQAEALKTAEPRAHDDAYLFPAIVAEHGELVGHLAKAHWHGTPAPEDLIIAEYGDLAWITAIALHTRGISEIPPEMAHPSRTTLVDPPTRIASLTHRLYTTYLDDRPQTTGGTWAGLWITLSRGAESITGATWDRVLKANLSKLADRANRGVLRGSGDER